MFAAFAALLPKITSFFANESFFNVSNLVRGITSKDLCINVLVKGQLCYLVTTRHKETTAVLKRQLEYMHMMLISLITNQVISSLERAPNLDVKSSVAGLERPLHMMAEMVDKSPMCMLNSYPVLSIHPRLRDDIT